MIRKKIISSLMLVFGIVATSAQGSESFELGGDVYRGDDDATLTDDVSRDVFIAGFSVDLDANVAQDAHAAGFGVDIKGDVGRNLYAAGSNIEVDGRVGEDLTASGFTVSLNKDASVLGNARIAAANIIIDAPIAGSLVATGGTVKINGLIKGDVRISAADIKFGKQAAISGTLDYSSTDEIIIPSNVISSDRVSFTRLKSGDSFRDFRDTVDDSVPDLWPGRMLGRLTGVVLLLTFLLIVASVFLAFAPETIERLRQRATDHAWRSIFYGFLGMSTLFGAILVSAITIVGIPLVPIVILALITVWALGYLLGVYVIAARIWRSLEIPSNAVFSNLLVLASGLIAMVVVNFIPFFGWLINLGVLFFGVGAMTYLVMERLVRRHERYAPKALPEPITATGEQ